MFPDLQLSSHLLSNEPLQRRLTPEELLPLLQIHSGVFYGDPRNVRRRVRGHAGKPPRIWNSKWDPGLLCGSKLNQRIRQNLEWSEYDWKSKLFDSAFQRQLVCPSTILTVPFLSRHCKLRIVSPVLRDLRASQGQCFCYAMSESCTLLYILARSRLDPKHWHQGCPKQQHGTLDVVKNWSRTFQDRQQAWKCLVRLSLK